MPGFEQGPSLLITTLIGLLAATCTTGSFLPQVIRAWRTRSTRDVSALMFVLLVTGNALWLLYGALIGDLPARDRQSRYHHPGRYHPCAEASLQVNAREVTPQASSF